MKKKIFLIFLLIPFLGACSLGAKKSQVSVDIGGLFISGDKGENWQSRNAIPNISGQAESIVSLNNSVLSPDPSDANAIYFGSTGNGLYYSYNNGREWQKAQNLSNGMISAIAIDPKNKCNIYVSLLNRVYNSKDCNRSWEEVYFDTDVNIRINDIKIDHYNSDIIYLATSRGEIIKSYDMANSWQTVGRFDDSIKRILLSPQNSRILFIGTTNKGIYKSNDGGGSWLDLKPQTRDLERSIKIRDMAMSSDKEGLIVIASTYGMLVSNDYGENWARVNLITPERGATINSIAINPLNHQEIYYITNTTFYRSLDGGENWASKKLPSSRAGWSILVNHENPEVIYLGVRTIK